MPGKQLDVVHSPLSSPPISSSSSKKATTDPLAPVPMSVDDAEMDLEPQQPLAPQSQPAQWDDLYSRMPLYGWFKVEGDVFCLDISRYIDESLYMASLYKDLQDYHVTKPGGSEAPKPGVLQTCPIDVQGINKEQMILFMEVLKIHRGWNESPLKDKTERQFIKKLDIPAQSPAFRLYAALKFKDESLLHSAVNTLVFTLLNKSQPDLSLLSFKVFRALTLAQDAVMVQRAAIGSHFPMIANITDVKHRHDDCEITCDHLWQLHITTDLLRGDKPAPNAHDSFLGALADSDDINPGCKDHLRLELTTLPEWEVAWGNESTIMRQLRLKISRLIQEGSNN
ncbi:hypothetical protein BJ165DRAFT_1534998 [Panaeolus papilionaceus]|nr:hypothetical protein BJ165DRAFT_1534998 [Panaeolus papilionaceus]